MVPIFVTISHKNYVVTPYAKMPRFLPHSQLCPIQTGGPKLLPTEKCTGREKSAHPKKILATPHMRKKGPWRTLVCITPEWLIRPAFECVENLQS